MIETQNVFEHDSAQESGEEDFDGDGKGNKCQKDEDGDGRVLSVSDYWLLFYYIGH